MERDPRLQRYGQKDYSERVEFPVDIVGRDGVVRRYWFEDALRLYQRRMLASEARYGDLSLIKAEVAHCESRILQLRESYFARFGWGVPPGELSGPERFGPLSADIAAWLRRVLRVEGRLPVALQALDEEQSLYHLTFDPETSAGPVGMLLHVHRFEEGGVQPQETFYALVKQLQRLGRSSGEGEYLIGFYASREVGLALTARAEDTQRLALPLGALDPLEPPEALRAEGEVVLRDHLRLGQLEQALGVARRCALEQPWNREGHLVGALVAGRRGDPQEQLAFALVGRRYFPDDPGLMLAEAQALLALGERQAASEAAARVVARRPERAAAWAVQALALIEQGRLLRALHVLESADGRRFDDSRLSLALVRLARRLRIGLLVAVVAGLTLASALLLLPDGLLPALLGLAGVALTLAAWWFVRQGVWALGAQVQTEEPLVALRRNGRNEAQTLPT